MERCNPEEKQTTATEEMRKLRKWDNLRKSFLTTEQWVQIYSNQKEIKYISPSNIRASVENHPPKLNNLLQFSPPSIPDIFWASPPATPTYF